jgi:hypothetical protein
VEDIPISQTGMKTGLLMLLAIIGLPLGGWLTPKIFGNMLLPSLVAFVYRWSKYTVLGGGLFL